MIERLIWLIILAVSTFALAELVIMGWLTNIVLIAPFIAWVFIVSNLLLEE